MMEIPTTTAGAIAGAVIALTTLAIWLLKRRNERSPEQKQDDAQAQVDRLEAAILDARHDGNDALADALRRRLRALQGIGIPERGVDAQGKCNPVPDPGRDEDPGRN